MALGKMGLVAAAFLAAIMPAAASAATLTFNLTGNSSTSGSYGNTRNFSATADGKTVNVQVSAWSAQKSGNGYTVQNAFLGAYGTGLGVTNRNEGKGGSNSHTIDNYKDGFDFIVFRFDQDVDIKSLTFTPYSVGGSTDSDAWVGIGQTDVAFGGALSFSNWANDVAMFDTFFESSGGNKASTRNINPLNETGNLLFVGGSLTDFTKKGGWDGFKIRALTVETVLPPPTPAVPEPATWAMMLAGFGLIGGALRNRAARPALARNGCFPGEWGPICKQ